MMSADGHYACSLWNRPTHDGATEEASNDLGQILTGQIPQCLVFSAGLSGFLAELPFAETMCDALWVTEEPETLTQLYNMQMGAGAAALVTQTRQCSVDKLRKLDESLRVESLCFQATRAAYKAAPRFVLGLIDHVEDADSAEDARLYAQQAQAFAKAAAHGIVLYDMPSVEAATQALCAIRPVFSRPLMCCLSQQALVDEMCQTPQSPQTPEQVPLTPKQVQQRSLQHVYQRLVELGADAVGFSNVSTSFARSVCKDSVAAAEQCGCGCLFVVTDTIPANEVFPQDINALLDSGVRIIGVGNTSNINLVADIARCMNDA
ncbi:homocysteine S-methyltransferase family protein [Atopobium deltae]|uniref:Hcy-binding domain-containing protein n=1 Tax=Atopobium deltae TaxID=1393034 RepID=A0A133XWB8_9ACTN|nr:homocysteine S-methyltransferase family protein [Atopobium deltae]KXB35230.1 hypothetical protein HMPREF3192_00307 [Atopobium deltae]